MTLTRRSLSEPETQEADLATAENSAVDEDRKTLGQDDREHRRAAVYCASALIRHRQLRGEPVPGWLRRHSARCEAALDVSRLGHETDDAPAQLEEMITAQEAASMLGCSKRQAQRLANDLGGQLVGGRWLFRRDAVAEYAEGKRNA